jgi:hypothetical protein
MSPGGQIATEQKRFVTHHAGGFADRANCVESSCGQKTRESLGLRQGIVGGEEAIRDGQEIPWAMLLARRGGGFAPSCRLGA